MSAQLGAVMELQKRTNNEAAESSHSKETAEAGERRPWPELPHEILEKVVSHLHLADRIRFPAVCKLWRAFPIPPDHKDQPPWLARVFKREGLCHLHDMSCSKTYRFVSPELVGASIHSSRFGWLLLSRPGLSIFFFNPLTSEKIDLPPLASDRLATAAFSAPPTSASCMVCAISLDRPDAVTAYIYRRGDTSWLSSRRSPNFLGFFPESRTSVLCNGLFYCSHHGNRVGVFDPVSVRWVGVLHSFRPRNPDSQTFIGEFEGEVYMLCVPSPERPIQILRFYYPGGSMAEVGILGDRALFMTPQTVMMTDGLPEGMEDKIHYPLFQAPAGGEPVGYYSLETQTHHPSLLYNLPMEMSKLVLESSGTSCAWFEPRVGR